MKNVRKQVLNWIFQIDATIKCKFDAHQSCRARWCLSYRWRPFLNSLSEIRQNLNIKPLTIKNVLECMENVLKKFITLIFQTDATIGCKFDVHQSCTAPRGLSYHWWLE